MLLSNTTWYKHDLPGVSKNVRPSAYLRVPGEAIALLVLDDLCPAISCDQLLVLVEHEKSGESRDSEQLRRGAAGLPVKGYRKPWHISHVSAIRI